MHRATIDVYEAEGANYARRRGPQDPARPRRFAEAVDAGGADRLRLDLGCGPGHPLPHRGGPAVAVDAAQAMAVAARHAAPEVAVVRADLERLPFGRATFAGVWASKAHQHIGATDLPLALAEVHRILTTGGRLELTMFGGEPGEEVTAPGGADDLPGRFFSWWDPARLATVVEAAGFAVEDLTVVDTGPGTNPRLEVTATAQLALPDHVRAGLRLLCCGLNPSIHAAEAGVGFVTPSNRFWRALAEVGIAQLDRDPRALARAHGIGMTDLVKRATPRAAELTTAEYRAGLERLDALCRWLEPASVVMVGLAGWRAATDRKARSGWQTRLIGGRPVYVMPSTSGLNAGTSLADLARHLEAALNGP